jgi:hypothetical protein
VSALVEGGHLVSIVVVALIVVSALALLAVQANQRFHDEDRLPMQWGLDGTVTWTAPRVVALAFFPLLASITFASLLILAVNVKPRTGDDAMTLPAFVGIGTTFVAIQLLHFWLIARQGRNKAD